MNAAAISGVTISNATQFLPKFKLLETHEKLFLIQFLVAELAQKEHPLFLSGQVFPVWSPHDSFGAANTMLAELQKHKRKHNS